MFLILISVLIYEYPTCLPAGRQGVVIFNLMLQKLQISHIHVLYSYIRFDL